MKELLTFIMLFAGLSVFAQDNIKYTNDMDYVLGDVKQAFIHDKISNKTQVDNLIKGFKSLKVNGIRIPIFAEGLEPNKAMLDYFFEQAKAYGFKIFANPALTSGGIRIANVVFKDEDAGGSVWNDPVKTQVLIDRIKAFAIEYPCDWICPFNEDGRPGKKWSVAQYNAIFQGLLGQLNGAELVGSCQWGLEAGILTFDKTETDQYISVATSHNLGFNHNLWSTFINKARAKGLPVWDSEVNHNQKYPDRLTRLEAALENKVDGLVIYNSWRGINLSNGTLNNTERVLEQQALFLDSQTSVNDLYGVDSVFVYPNPASEFISVSGYVNVKQLSLIDLQGKIVRSQSEANQLIVEGLSRGIYILKLELFDGHVKYMKVTINS
ncbi:T9SS type A sorting domain-containing protein [Marinilabilia rubra]|uniref:Secretion system C-terminal sorting domain-containing protein n=1 Tax=Marinilabilia rubra TaxID=2162893 RepID=A0A2U2BE72_9BACT|nr:T9SS type A sorting domain-containing protein [Marinilabilia rubra]PWE01370.1 hypothetical protein DDZ16_02475 [Marinilabilia rubra]